MAEGSRKQRIAELKKGPGVFVYLGGAYDTEFIPGVPATDEDGNVLFHKKTRKVIWEKEPVLLKHELAVRKFGREGFEFPKGAAVHVDDPQRAFKLRCLPYMRELEAEGDAEPGRKAKGKKARAEE